MSKKIVNSIGFRGDKGIKLAPSQAEFYGKYILNLMKSKGKPLTPGEIVYDAESKDCPYHDYFDWKDSSAGQKFREMQARLLLGQMYQLKILGSDSKPTQVRLTINVNEDGVRGYVPFDYAITQPLLREQIIKEALKEVVSWKIRYEIYKELGGIIKSIDKTIKKVKI